MPEKEPYFTRREWMTLGGAGLGAAGLVGLAVLFRKYFIEPVAMQGAKQTGELVGSLAQGAAEAEKAVNQIARDVNAIGSEPYVKKPEEKKSQSK